MSTERAERDGRWHITVPRGRVLSHLRVGWMECPENHPHYIANEPGHVALVWLCECRPVVVRPF